MIHNFIKKETTGNNISCTLKVILKINVSDEVKYRRHLYGADKIAYI